MEDYLYSAQGAEKKRTHLKDLPIAGDMEIGWGRPELWNRKLMKNIKHLGNCIQMNKTAWRDGPTHMAPAQTEIPPAS